MIDISQEELLPLSEAAELLPQRRNGRRPHASTLFRWAKHGLKGIRLEVLRVGDTTCTSAAAIQRFLERLTAATLSHDASTPAESEHHLRVSQALDEMGA